MTEITDKVAINTERPRLTPAIERFVLHWGDMGGTWGVNRSVAQIHALLLVNDAPMPAEDIADALSMARSNVSTSIKELTMWNLVRRVPMRGDRRDHYEAEGDVWEMVARIIEMRKAREIDPAKAVLAQCLRDAKNDSSTSQAAVARLDDLQGLMDLLDGWYGQVKDTPKETLIPMIRMGSKAIDLLSPFTGKKKTPQKPTD